MRPLVAAAVISGVMSSTAAASHWRVRDAPMAAARNAPPPAARSAPNRQTRRALAIENPKSRNDHAVSSKKTGP